MLKRRDFIKQTALAGSLLPISSYLPGQALDQLESAEKLEVHLFSKHLQFLDYKDMAAAAKALGFDGLDLTVRPKGHVLPERVKEDLPKAVDAVKAEGLQAKMMATKINQVSELAKSVLETAADLGIKYYRMEYYRYPEHISMPQAFDTFKAQAWELAQMNKQLGLQASYQNHAGTMVGSSIWEIWQLLNGIPEDLIGCQYDIRHAVVEGGHSWQNGLRLIHPRINTLVIKDFKWAQVEGEWKLVNVPLGEGMVDFNAYFKLLKKYGIRVPVSMHFEYPMGGANHGTSKLEGWTEEQVFAAMKRDLNRLHEMWAKADEKDE